MTAQKEIHPSQARYTARWSKEEDQLILDNAGKLSAEDMSSQVFHGTRSSTAIAARAHKQLKVNLAVRRTVWTESMDNIIREFSPIRYQFEVRELLNKHIDEAKIRTGYVSDQKVYTRAKILGVKARPRHTWPDEDKALMLAADNEQMSVPELAALMPHRNEPQIRSMAKSMGLTLKRAQYKKRGPNKKPRLSNLTDHEIERRELSRKAKRQRSMTSSEVFATLTANLKTVLCGNWGATA